jgi:hypothetical protein
MKGVKKIKKRNFSSFNLKDAYKELNLIELIKWETAFKPIQASSFFQENLQRLEVFDLKGNETAKTLVIDAFLEEALQPHKKLKAWKEPILEGETLTGIADYLLTERRDYFDLPFLCAVEAKKDDFEQGLAQCLVEMKACKEANLKEGKDIDIYGIITNSELWHFCKYSNNKVYFNKAFVSDYAEDLIGMLDYVFAECEKNIDSKN